MLYFLKQVLSCGWTSSTESLVLLLKCLNCALLSLLLWDAAKKKAQFSFFLLLSYTRACYSSLDGGSSGDGFNPPFSFSFAALYSSGRGQSFAWRSGTTGIVRMKGSEIERNAETIPKRFTTFLLGEGCMCCGTVKKADWADTSPWLGINIGQKKYAHID